MANPEGRRLLAMLPPSGASLDESDGRAGSTLVTVLEEVAAGAVLAGMTSP